ncbi:UDP-N-acetylmuramate--L-alanine ligase [Candidatus Peregrinibacteria bacterium]|nr:UDP-N-acetylmuramate--L-alanine ligase [Candidatus Peregrinibacteria bacterium]
MQDYKKIHFIGIGGIGISALAYLSLAEGKQVTGSDVAESALLDDLRKEGAAITIGHDGDLVTDDTELVVYTEAIDPLTNPEYQRAKKLGLPLLSYFQALGQVSRTKKTIAVVGTHGKTTTTAMLGLALIRAGLDPTVIVGSKLKEFGRKNLYIGGGDLFVVEGCEYRRSFLNLTPFGVVFLNCEAEHLDYYKNEENYRAAYRELIDTIPADGFLVVNQNDKNACALAENCAGKVITVGPDDAAKLDIDLAILGDFNRLNAVHAYKAAKAVDANMDEVREALEDFRGAWRRLEHKGAFRGGLVIDDYGHHPTEVRLTIEAVKKAYPGKRLICVFQPHQHSRTHQMLEEFKEAFGAADKVIITDIYAARDTEEDKAKINAEKLAGAIHHPDTTWGKDLDHTFRLLQDEVKKDDVVLVMGAGSIGTLAERLTEK